MKNYEVVFILDIRKNEDEGKQFCREFAEFVRELGGEIKKENPMGKRQLVRPIKKKKAAIYWDFVFSLTPDKVHAIRNKYRLDERVLRLMVMVYDNPEPV